MLWAIVPSIAQELPVGPAFRKVQRLMRRFLPLALCIAALGSFSGVVLAPSAVQAGVPKLEKLAVVDVQRCILETAEGKRKKKELERSFAKGNKRLEKKGKSLQKEFADLQAKSAMLSDSELMRRQQDLMRKDQELQELYAKLGEDLSGKEALMTEAIYKNVHKIVKQMALEESIQVVLVRSDATVLYANPKLDLTNKVIVAYDKEHK